MVAKIPSRTALSAARKVVARVATHLAAKSSRDGRIENDRVDAHQQVAFDLAVSTAELAAAEEAIAFAERKAQAGEAALEEKLAEMFLAETLLAIRGRFAARVEETGVTRELIASTLDDESVERFVADALAAKRADEIVVALESRAPDRGLTDDQRAFADAFKQFADTKVTPHAEQIHRQDLLVPTEIVDGLKELGVFGLSIPQKFGGIQPDDRPDNMGMVVVTEELSRGSLAAAGSLITRPEILSKAILKGGTDEQKQKWLPKLASGEAMAGVMVTEPDYGSDVAGVKVMATKTSEHGGGWLINGVKTWCTFAGFANTLMVLVRTDPDRKKGHKGLSLLIAEKPSFGGHEFACAQSGAQGAGKMEGKAIPTLGYRGMHSFEVSFENWFVPDANLIGGEKGLGQGFYLQMEGFSGGRLQTAARALGVMQAAFEAALRYARDRKIFGKAEIEFGLTKSKISRIAMAVHVCRQATYRAARLLDEGAGQMNASMVKLHACRVAEWVTREAMQIHGGMGYAEEFPVSRYFVDARVLSIFEGAEEVLALRVVARQLLESALKPDAVEVA